MKNDNDQEWLDALSGITRNSPNTLPEIEAIAIRRAFLSRRQLIEKDIKNFDSAKFELFRNTLIESGHLLSEEGTGYSYKQKVSLFVSFIAGSISSVLIVFATMSQVLVPLMNTRSSPETKEESKLNNSNIYQSTPTTTLYDHDPFSLAQAIENKAWTIGLKTTAQSSDGGILLTIHSLPEDDINASDLKLLIGVHPKVKGDLMIKIIR